MRVPLPRTLLAGLALGSFAVVAVLLAAQAVLPGQEGPASARPGASAPDFGPQEDGKAKSHEDLEKAGWVYLFDSRPQPGDPLGLWRFRDPKPARILWSVTEEEGQRVLKNTIGPGAHGTDLISKQSFWDFDVHVELRVPADSNSGVYLRGRYEIQILSTPAGKDHKLGPHDLGGIYSVRAPGVNASRGPGKWQTLEASIRGFEVVQVRLNGEVIHQNVVLPEEKLRGTGSELKQGDGVSPDPSSPGPLFLQGDHGSVDFRNIRVRPHPAAARGPSN